MAIAIDKSSFIVGEVSPSLYGHVDLAKFAAAASTMRNMFVSYRGGAYSRAGTAFVGFSKQTGRAYPPRLIPFDFDINQGLALEFGNQYMRVVSDGGFVTDASYFISGATQANPCVLTVADATVASATPNNGSVSASYAPNDTVTLAGGTFSSAGVLNVNNTTLVSLALNNPGDVIYGSNYIGYRPGDSVTLAGGVSSESAQIVVLTTKVIGVTLFNGGSGGTPGPATLTIDGGVGTAATIDVTIGAGGNVTSINSFTGGSYTTNPPFTDYPYYAYLLNTAGGGYTSPNEPSVVVAMGIDTFVISVGGIFTENASGGSLSQLLSSGGGDGATFNTAIFAPNALSVSSPGAYSVAPTNPVAQASTSGSGAGATFNVNFDTTSGLANGQWVQIEDVGGMTELNGNTYVIGGLSGSSFALYDVYGNAIDSSAYSAYTSGGVALRIFETSTPYNEQDLPWLKFAQSADVMSLCCINQQTQTEYAPQDLTRISDTDWTFAPVVPAPTVTPPASASAVASTSGDVDYQYVVTSVNDNDGTESIASPIAEVDSAVDIAATAGTITVTWSAVAGIGSYNIYKATPGYSTAPPVGSLFGFAGQAYGTQFIDSNIVADFSQVPPTHQNPFARGQLISATVTNGGSGSSFTITINTSSGSGAVLVPVIVSDVLVAILVVDAGQNYALGDTLSIDNGATATLTVGAESGTYPSVPSYFQERRVYGNSLNNPDTYWMSQPGSFTNFDTRTPTIASDAITGAPWSQQVNGIQALVQTSGGLLVLTGLQAWLLVGQGSFATNVQAISPSSQVANRQPAIGCSPTVPPIAINYDVIYVQAKGSFYLDLPYQLYALSEPIDLTENSSQLFLGYTIREHAWCEQPYKVVWSVRNDGVMLSLTYYKTQQVAGWGRHDTQGLFQSVCSVTEPPVDALYTAVQRFINGNSAYMIERMDNRVWAAIEDTWCVDAGLQLPQPTPSATLTASSATGLGACTGVTGLLGGTGYSAGTTATVVDMGVDNDGQGPGTGAVPTLTIVSGVITAVAFSSGNQGTGYVNPRLVIVDPAGSAGGSGGFAIITLSNIAIFTASAAVFSSGNVGDVIRMGGGIATITAYTDSEHVTANITTPITDVFEDSTGAPVPQPQPSGAWTLTTPVTKVSGLNHLIGASVTGLADGNVIPPQTVAADGSITLSTAASAITVGLGFMVQLQSTYLELGGAPTVQGQRKKIAAVTARLELSRDIQVGSNQPDGATLSPPQLAPTWSDLTSLPNKAIKPYNSATTPLYTGDARASVQGGFQTPGQVALQQSNPVPMNILSLAIEEWEGDEPEVKAPQQGRGQ